MPACIGAVAVTSSCLAVHIRPAPAPRRPVEHDDAELPAVEGRARTRRARRLERVRVVRDEHDRRVAMGTAAVVHDLQSGCRRARAEDLRRRLCDRARLGVAVRRPPNCVAVDSERNVVEEEAPVHLGYVRSGARRRESRRRARRRDPRGQRRRRGRSGYGYRRGHRRTEARARARPRPRRRATRRRRRRRARPPRPPGLVDERLEVVAGAQDDHVDAALACPLGKACAGCLAAAGPQVDEQHGPLYRSRRRPGVGRHAARRSRSDRRDCSVGGS